MAVRYVVEVSGFRQIVDALDEVDKRAAQRIKKEITNAGKSVVSAAQREVIGRPMSGWGIWTATRDGRDLGFEPTKVRANIRLRKNNFRRRGVSAGLGYDVYNMNPGGAIFEVVGDYSRVTTPSGRALVDYINRKYTSPKPRILYSAYYAGMPANLREKIRDQILDEARKAGLR